MSGAPGSRRGTSPVVLAVLLFAAVLCGGTLFLVSDRAQGTKPGWSGFEADRVALLRTLAAPVLACVGRVDDRARGSAMFHGCGDWHNAVAGHYALYTSYRRTGDVTYLRAAEEQIRDGASARRGVPVGHRYSGPAVLWSNR